MRRVEAFVSELASWQFENSFNPYRDICPQHDLHDAAAIRQGNLRSVVKAHLAIGVESIWLGRDLGYRGGRRTGLALTDEPNLQSLREHLGIRRVAKATSTAAVGEQTARDVWTVVRGLPHPPFLWNVFPFHSHEPSDPMTNRKHSAAEGRLSEDILVTLLRWLSPERVVALGADAYRTLCRVGYTPALVRHPSYGGKAAFLKGIADLYSTR